jgi:hypothetical protein
MLGGLVLRARARSFPVIERSTTDWLARSVGNSRCLLRLAHAERDWALVRRTTLAFARQWRPTS